MAISLTKAKKLVEEGNCLHPRVIEYLEGRRLRERFKGKDDKERSRRHFEKAEAIGLVLAESRRIDSSISP